MRQSDQRYNRVHSTRGRVGILLGIFLIFGCAFASTALANYEQVANFGDEEVPFGSFHERRLYSATGIAVNETGRRLLRILPQP